MTTRVATGLVLCMIVTGLLWLPAPLLLTVLLLVAAGIIIELNRVLAGIQLQQLKLSLEERDKKCIRPWPYFNFFILTILALLCAIGWLSLFNQADILLILTGSMLTWVIISLCFYNQEDTLRDSWVSMAMVSTVIMTGSGLVGFFLLQQSQMITLGYLIGLTALSDSAGYFIGKAHGRRHVFPQLSPQKTEFGTIAMLAVPVITVLLLRAGGFISPNSFWFFIGPLALIGDLWISQLKRAAKIKDTGTIFPGHGGMLDRIDSHIFVLSIACVLLHN